MILVFKCSKKVRIIGAMEQRESWAIYRARARFLNFYCAFYGIHNQSHFDKPKVSHKALDKACLQLQYHIP